MCFALQPSLADAQNAPADVRADAVFAGITGPLSSIPVPDVVGLDQLVRDRAALLVLGKALFWDQQLGSDGNACASCHFHAGADNRARNQLNPGLKNESAQFPVGDTMFGNTPFPGVAAPSQFGPSYELKPEDFPLHKLSDPTNRASAALSDTNDVVSSQGVFNAGLISPALPFDIGSPIPWIFNVGGALVRNVEPRNTASTINAAFNHRNFWDGRARANFNGVNPFGELDPEARVVQLDANAGAPSFAAVQLGLASLASQAVGPPLSDIEMAFHGVTYPKLGRKLLDAGTVVLANQRVAPTDSVLGAYSLRGTGATPGTSLRYRALVEEAFWPRWWDAPGWRVQIEEGRPALVQSEALNETTFTVMEYNFPLFFGLALAEYQRTLVSDQTPFDRFMAGDDAALTAAQLAGLELFVDPVRGRCVACHGGPELTTASVRLAGAAPLARMILGDGTVGAYDEGFYNIGVRPSAEDASLGGRALGVELSIAQRLGACVTARVDEGQSLEQANTSCAVPRILAVPVDAWNLLVQAAALAGNPPDVVALLDQADELLRGGPNEVEGAAIDLVAASVPLFQARDALVPYVAIFAEIPPLLADATLLLPDPNATILPDPPLPIPEPPPPGTRFAPYGPLLGPNERTVANGAFKTPSLRNVELTAPYFHNGGQATLEQVVEFYDRGGDFGHLNPQDLDVDILPLGLTAADESNLVAFLKALTDERVRWDRAPFDHPSLEIPNGGTAGNLDFSLFAGMGVLDDRIVLPETGAHGAQVPLGTSHTPFANFLQPLTPRAPPPTSVTLTAAATSPQPVGTAVRFDAQGNGSTSRYEYRFWLYQDGEWHVVQDYGDASSWTMPGSTPAGSYLVAVHVRTDPSVFVDVQGVLPFVIGDAPAPIAPATGVTLTPNRENPQPLGTAVRFDALGQGGSGAYQYRFWLFVNGAWQVVQEYGDAASWTMPLTTPAGSYRVAVHVRTDPLRTVDAEAIIPFAIGVPPDPATAVTLTPSVPSPQAPGTPVQFDAQGQGGTGVYQYRFWLLTDGAWRIVQDYGFASSWLLPTSIAVGAYQVAVHVRTNSGVFVDAQAVVPFVIGTPAVPATGATLTPSLTSPQPQGTPVRFDAQGLGSPDAYQYKFWLFVGGAWQVVQEYGAVSSWTAPTTLPEGQYRVAVHVRTSPAAFVEAEATVPYVIGAPHAPTPASGATLIPALPSPQPSGTAVRFDAQGEGSPDPYEYRFWMFVDGGWREVQPYGPSSSWTLPASTPPGSYLVAVHVRTDPTVLVDVQTVVPFVVF